MAQHRPPTQPTPETTFSRGDRLLRSDYPENLGHVSLTTTTEVALLLSHLLGSHPLGQTTAIVEDASHFGATYLAATETLYRPYDRFAIVLPAEGDATSYGASLRISLARTSSDPSNRPREIDWVSEEQAQRFSHEQADIGVFGAGTAEEVAIAQAVCLGKSSLVLVNAAGPYHDAIRQTFGPKDAVFSWNPIS